MAFSSTGLALVAGSKAGNAPQIWSYQSADAIADVNTEGYFNSVASLMKVGDLIYVYDTATPTANLVVVLSNTGTVVDVSNGQSIAVTDSD
jgi:hypothetical protein